MWLFGVDFLSYTPTGDSFYWVMVQGPLALALNFKIMDELKDLMYLGVYVWPKIKAFSCIV